MTEHEHRVIVVGYDGTPASHAALDYAAGEARPQDEIVVVHVENTLDPATTPSILAPAVMARLEHGQSVLDAIPLQGHNDLIDHDYEVVQLTGPAADCIIGFAEARDADEIVAGSRGRGAVRGALLGSTSRALLDRAGRPVTVVHAGEGAHA